MDVRGLHEWIGEEVYLKDYRTLAMDSHLTAVEKGWWVDQYGADGQIDKKLVREVVEEKLALIHSEVSEALEDYRRGKMVTELRLDGKPVGFPTELADVVIRCFDLQCAVGMTEMRRTVCLYKEGVSIPRLLNRLHKDISDATEVFLDSGKVDVMDVAVHAIAIGKSLGIDMLKEILDKHAYNKTRTYRHGFKRC